MGVFGMFLFRVGLEESSLMTKKNYVRKDTSKYFHDFFSKRKFLGADTAAMVKTTSQTTNEALWL